MFKLAHESPCRLRLVASVLRTDVDRGETLLRHVLAIPGVTGADVRLASGSLVVFHDGTPESRDDILRALGVPIMARRGSDTTFPVLDAIIEAAMQKLLARMAGAIVAVVLS